MAWISGWLKELIVIVLIAGFIDLLLPAPSMQRYVKTVIGLFLLLVMLSPIFRLFESKWTADGLIAAAEAKQEAVSGSSFRPLDDILREGSKLQADNAEHAQRLLETQLASSIRSGIETQLQKAVESVSVKTSIAADGTPSVRSIEVVLAQQGAAKTKPDDSANEPFVKPVKPVIVDIAPIGGAEPAVPAAAANNASDGAHKAAADEVKNYVSREWQVKPEVVDVTIKQTPSG